MALFSFQCPRCQKEVKTDTSQSGMYVNCPECKGGINIPSIERHGPPFALIGWILFILGMMLICTFPLCIPLFFAAFVMGILSIVINNQTKQGIALIGCSVISPIITIVIVPLMMAGTALAALFSGMEQAAAPLKPAPVSIAAPVSSLPIQDPGEEMQPVTIFLNRMNEYGRAHREAGTSVQKDEIRKAAIETASAILKETPKMTLRATIRDVRNPSEDITIVSFGDYDLGGFERRSDKSISVSCWGQMKIEMNRGKALSITPGSTFEITGTPVFETSNTAIHGEPTTEAQRVMRLSLGVLEGPFGALIFRDPKPRILVKKLKKD